MRSKLRAYEEVASKIRENIIAGELEDGDRISAEVKLAAEMEVGRSTVREALRTLEEEGYIERASPQIFVVSRQWRRRTSQVWSRAMQRAAVTMNDLHEALVAIEPEIARLAATRANASAVQRLRENLEQQAQSIGDYKRWCRLDEEFHLAIALSIDNPALVLARAPIVEMLSPVYHRFPDGRSVASRATDYHHRIVTAIEEADPEVAALMARRHVLDSRIPWDQAGVDFTVPVTELGESLLREEDQAVPKPDSGPLNGGVTHG
jgi:GntR family transcriptional regulator, transcriptional repressor for pyruvate dehydrogenase complex